MITRGLVFAERPYKGKIIPTTYEDISRYRNICTPTNAPTWKRLPSGRWALTYSAASDQYVDLGSSAVLKGIQTFTVICWTFCTSVPTDRAFMGNRDSAGTNPGWKVFCKASTCIYVVLIDIGASSISLDGSGSKLNAWHMIAVTRTSAGAIELFGNGISENTGTLAGDITSTANTRVGSSPDSIDGFEGDLALSRIYTRLLAAEEIAAIYQSERHLFGR